MATGCMTKLTQKWTGLLRSNDQPCLICEELEHYLSHLTACAVPSQSEASPDMQNRKAFDLLMQAVEACTSSEHNEIKAGM